MKARRLIETATFAPAALRVIYEAFDNAWTEIAPHFEGDDKIEDARTRLAHAV